MGEHTTTLTVPCKNPACGKAFTARAYYISSGRRMYCSRACYNATRPRGFGTSTKTDYQRKKESIARHRDKHNCRHRFKYAMTNGDIHVQPCVLCGDVEAEAHHWDYTKALNVLWLCRQHHTDVHKGRIILMLPESPNFPAVDCPVEAIAHPARIAV
jgi:hypothetical protein